MLMVYRDHILALIDSLQQEQQEEPDKSMEEAAGEYEKKHTYQRYDGGGLTPEYDETLAEAFIAGAKWQKQQMLKDAVEGEIHLVGFNNTIFIKEPRAEILDRYNAGDKVRIIIVKAEEE